MATMSLESAEDEPCPRIYVTVDDLALDVRYTLWRQVDGEIRQGVHGGVALGGPTIFLLDGQAPLGRPVRYELTVPSGEIVASATAQVDSTTCWLQDPFDLKSAIPVDIGGRNWTRALGAASLSELTFDVPQQVVAVPGSPDPWTSSGTIASPSNIPLVIMAAGHQPELDALMRHVTVLCLRTLPHMPELTATTYIATGARTRTTRERKQNLHRWSMTAQSTRPPALSRVATEWTWGDLEEIFPPDLWTWGDVETALSGRTWLQLERDPRP